MLEGYTLKVKIKKIPIPTFSYEGYWVDIVNSSYVSALAMSGKQLWQYESKRG